MASPTTRGRQGSREGEGKALLRAETGVQGPRPTFSHPPNSAARPSKWGCLGSNLCKCVTLVKSFCSPESRFPCLLWGTLRLVPRG